MNPVTSINSATTQESSDAVHAPEWQASLELVLRRRGPKTQLSRNRHCGPLYVQKPFYPEGPELAHIYLLHPPGGIVMGDTLETEVTAEAESQVLLTTPGANRFYGRGVTRYNSRSAEQIQINRLNVATGASLEWLPLETLVYDNANARMQTEISLAEDARYIGWEFNCLGLPASDQPFTHGDFRQSLRITRNNRPLFIDRLNLHNGGAALRDGLAGLRGHTTIGTLVAGPFPAATNTTELLEKLREQVAERDAENRVAVSAFAGLIVARYLGDSAMQGRHDFIPLWDVLRQSLLGRKACQPRIWAT